MDKIFNLGITEDQSTYLKGKILLTNQLAIILFCVGLTYGLLAISFPPITLLAAIGIVLCLLVLLLNYCKFYNASRILIALMPPTVLSLIHANIAQPNDPIITSLSIGYVAISVIPFLIFDMREIKLMLSTIIIIWIIFMFQDHTNNWIQTPMDSSLFYEPFMVLATNLINVCIITFTLIFFQLKNYKSEKENDDLISKLQHQKEKLATQRDFIKTQNEKILTANSRLEATVKQKEQQLKYLIESSEDMITLHDEQGTYLYFNGPKNANIQAEEIVGKTPYDLFDHESAKHISDAIKKVFISGKSMTFENRLNWNGTKKWFSEYIYPVKDREGNIKSVAKICQDIENRKIAEQKLKESKERLSVIYNNSKDATGLIKVHKDGSYSLESANQSFIELIKKSGTDPNVNDLVGLNLIDLWKRYVKLSNEEIKERLAVLDEVCRSKKRAESETYKDIDKVEQIVLERTFTPILDNQKNCRSIHFVLRNVTDKIKAETALKISENRLSLIYNNTQDYVGLLRYEEKGSHFILESINEPFWRLLRKGGSEITKDDIIEKDISTFYKKSFTYSNELIVKRLKTLQEVVKSKKIITFEGNVETQSKTKIQIHFENTLSPILDSNGNCTHILFVVKDISKQKKAESLLNQSREEINKQLQLNQLILNTTFDGYLLVDSNADVVDVNPAYCDLIGYSREELMKMNINDLEVKFSQKEVELHLEYLKENGANRVESQHLRKDGTIIDVDTNLNLLQFEGKPMIAGFVRDITAEKQAQKELEYRSNFEHLLTKISSQFINLPLENLDQGINEAIEQLCKFIGFDRVGIVLFSLVKEYGSLVYEWYNPGFGPVMDNYQDVPNDTYPWLIERLKKNELLVLTSQNDLPEGGEMLKSELNNMGIQSLINVPLFWQDVLIGFIGFNAQEKQQKLPNDLELLLRFASEMISNVLQRKKGEMALKNSEEQLSMIYNNSTEYVGLIRVEKGDQFYLETLNKTTIDAIKTAWPELDIQQLIGMEILGFLKKVAYFNNQQIKKTKKDFIQLVKLKKEKRSQGIIPIPLKGKPFFAYDANVIPIVNDQGVCNYILFVTQDVTEKKIAENATKASEQRLSQIYHNNMDFIGLIKVEAKGKFQIESVNRSVIDFLTQASGDKNMVDVTDMDIHTLLKKYLNFSEEEIDKRIAIVKQVINKRERVIYQNQLVSPIDGEMLVFETVISPILENGQCIQVLCVIKDITEKAKAKEALILSEQRLSSIFNSTKDLMTIFDIKKDGSIVFEQVNQPFIDVWKKAGYDLKPEELYGKEISYYNRNILGLTEAKAKERDKHLQRIIKSKKTYNFEQEYHTVNDTKLYLDITATHILNDKGKSDKLLFVARDISFRKKANERLILKILETEDRERKRISKELHDGLGQNLTTASLNLNYLKNAVSQIDDGYKIKFQNGIKFLNNAIDESRNIAHNLMPQSIIDFGFVMTIESLIDDLNETTNTQFVFYNNVNEERLISYHELSLFRITQEAINNVLKHAKASKVTIQLMKYPDALLLTIEDNGQGFDMEKTKGHAFGLNSMKARVSALSGSIHIDSSIGNGTSITIEIPI